jgi:hypothetical protein
MNELASKHKRVNHLFTEVSTIRWGDGVRIHLFTLSLEKTSSDQTRAGKLAEGEN